MRSFVSFPISLLVGFGLLILGGCGGSGSKPTSPNPSGDQVTISGLTFSALTVTVGTTVTWKNLDGMAHTATSDASSAFPFDTGSIAAGTTSAGITFTQAGTFPYHCQIHSSMHGTIRVQ